MSGCFFVIPEAAKRLSGIHNPCDHCYGWTGVMDSGLAPSKSAVADLEVFDCRCRVNPTSVARPGMTAEKLVTLLERMA